MGYGAVAVGRAEVNDPRPGEPVAAIEAVGAASAEPGASSAASRKRPARLAVTTLAGYLERKGIPQPKPLLTRLAKVGQTTFTLEDLTEALERLRETDAELRKSAALVWQAITWPDGSFGELGADYAKEVLREYLRGANSNPAALETTDLEEALGIVGRAATKDLDGRKTEARGVNAVLIGILWLAWTRGLQADRALLRARETLAARKPRKRAVMALDGRLARIAYLTEPRGRGVDELAELVDFISPWVKGEKAARDSAQLATDQAARFRQKAEEASGALSAARSEIGWLGDRVAELDRQVAQLTRERDEARSAGRLRLDTLRGEERAFLGARLARLLGTAIEALSLDPPRAHVAEEKLEVALTTLRDRVSQLGEGG